MYLDIDYSKIRTKNHDGEIYFISEYCMIFSRFSRRRKRSRSFTLLRRDAAYAAGYTFVVNFESGWYWVNPRPGRARNSVGLTAGTTFADLSRCLNISSSAAAAAAAASPTPRG